MQRLESHRSGRFAHVAFAIALTAGCTVFNGKSVPVDGGSAAEGGTPTVDASADAPASACGCATGTILCESFESASLGVTWSPMGDVTPHDTTRAHCGSGSLHVRSPLVAANSSDVAAITTDQVLRDPRLSAGFFARAWVYLPSSANLVGDNYFTLIEARQSADPFLGIGFQINGAQSTMVNWTATPSAFIGSGAAFPRDAWTCVEWQVSFGKGSGSSDVWLGGANKPVVSLAATNTAPIPGYADVILGAYVGAGGDAQPTFDLFIDDVAFAAERIGCGP